MKPASFQRFHGAGPAGGTPPPRASLRSAAMLDSRVMQSLPRTVQRSTRRINMARAVFVVLVAGLAACAGPAAADPTIDIPPAASTETRPAPGETAPAPGAEEGGRYSFHHVGGHFVRLDTRTGELAQCDRNNGVWSCRLVPDERAALEAEIGRLQRENAELKKALLSRGIELPAGVVAAQKPPSVAPPVPPADVPDATPHPPKPPPEADLDRAIAYMKHVWRKLVDMMLDLQRDVQRRI
jgi:hypothetical protein